jgi:hypothetical protein
MMANFSIVVGVAMKNPLISAMLLISVALGGCASTFKHSYHDVSPVTAARTDKAVAVASLDQREYVRSGQSKPDLVGMLRGGYGNPFDVRTESGRALSSEFTAAMRGALERNGIRAVAVETKPTEDERTVMTNLTATKGDCKLLLAIREWVSDSQINTDLTYDLQLTVADASGKILASKVHKDHLSLGGSVLNAHGHAREVVPRVFRETVESLLNSPEIVTALK